MNVFEEAMREVKGDTTWTNVSCVETSTGDALVKLHEFFTLLETPEERRESTNIHSV